MSNLLKNKNYHSVDDEIQSLRLYISKVAELKNGNTTNFQDKLKMKIL